MTRLEAAELVKLGKWSWEQYHVFLSQFYPDRNIWHYTGKEQV